MIFLFIIPIIMFSLNINSIAPIKYMLLSLYNHWTAE